VVDCKKESDLDAITIIAGSGPALVAYFVSLLSKSGQVFGLEKERGEKVALQIFIGTLTYYKQQNSPTAVTEAVATKGE